MLMTPCYRLCCRQAASNATVAANVYRRWGKESTPVGIKEGDAKGGKGNGNGNGNKEGNSNRWQQHMQW
jgi:hypothetical protein